MINTAGVGCLINWHSLRHSTTTAASMDKIESEKFKTAVRKLKAPKSEGVTSDMALKAGVAFALTMLVIVLIIFCLPDAIVRHEQVHIALGSKVSFL